MVTASERHDRGLCSLPDKNDAKQKNKNRGNNIQNSLNFFWHEVNEGIHPHMFVFLQNPACCNKGNENKEVFAQLDRVERWFIENVAGDNLVKDQEQEHYDTDFSKYRTESAKFFELV